MKKYLTVSLFILTLFLVSLPTLHAVPPVNAKESGKEQKTEKLPVLPNHIKIPVPDAKKALETEEFEYKDIAFFLQTLAVIRNSYVDKEKVTNEELFRKALRGLLRELDPFSNYESPEQFKHTQEGTSGSFAGIGVTIGSKGQAVEIIMVLEGSPAEKAGVKAGDILTAVDGKNVNGKDIPGCAAKLKGEDGSLVKLSLLRRGHNGAVSVSVRRGTVRMKSVVNAGIIAGRFGYMRIMQFSATTPGDILQALAKLKEKKAEGLVIDLRNNPGGLLTSAVGACSIFLPTGAEIVSTKGRLPSSMRTFSAVNIQKYTEIPLVILINGNSASAAEIFAGCLRDHKRAVLAGTKSFGKGSVQTLMPLTGNKGAVRLTTAKYYTPSKKVIHGVGITPDIAVPLTPKQQFELNAGFLSRINLPARDLDKAVSSDPQLARAVDLLKGITLLQKNKSSK